MSLVSVIETLKEYFGWTDEDVKRKENLLSSIYYLEKEEILKKANFYMTSFSLTQEEFSKMLKTSPALLSYNNESVLEKANFYKNTFKLSHAEFSKMLKTFPALLCLNNESMLDKVNFYMKIFDLSQVEFNKMLKISPTLLSYKNESVLEKKKNFDKIGLNKNDIIKNPSILTAPSNSLIFKYILLYIDFGNKSFLEKNWYMTSEKKTWARYTFIKQNGRVKPADVLIGEKIFQKRYGVESSVLMEKFPITKEVVEFVNSEYNKLAEKNGDKKLEIKFEDLQKKDKEKGE